MYERHWADLQESRCSTFRKELYNENHENPKNGVVANTKPREDVASTQGLKDTFERKIVREKYTICTYKNLSCPTTQHIPILPCSTPSMLCLFWAVRA